MKAARSRNSACMKFFSVVILSAGTGTLPWYCLPERLPDVILSAGILPQRLCPAPRGAGVSAPGLKETPWERR